MPKESIFIGRVPSCISLEKVRQLQKARFQTRGPDRLCRNKVVYESTNSN